MHIILFIAEMKRLHALGIILRDVRLSNFLRVDGGISFRDFGFAVDEQESSADLDYAGAVSTASDGVLAALANNAYGLEMTTVSVYFHGHYHFRVQHVHAFKIFKPARYQQLLEKKEKCRRIHRGYGRGIAEAKSRWRARHFGVG